MIAGAALLSRRTERSMLVAGVVIAAAIIGLVRDQTTIVILTTLVVGVLVAWIAWQDFQLFTIPDAAILSIAVLAFVSRWNVGRLDDIPLGQTVLAIGLDLAMSGGALLALREIYYRRKGHDGIGFGDVKLAGAGGILVGTLGFAWALFGASLAGLIFVAYRRLVKRPLDARGKIAFGAILAPSIWAVWIAQHMPSVLFAIER